MSGFAEWRPCNVCGLPVGLPKRTHDECLEKKGEGEMSKRQNCPAHGCVMARVIVVADGVEPGLVVHICPAGDVLTMQREDGLLVSYNLPNLYEEAVERHQRAMRPFVDDPSTKDPMLG